MTKHVIPRGKWMLIGLWTILLLCVGPLSSVSADQATTTVAKDIKITLNEKAVYLKDRLLMDDGKLSISASSIAGLLKAKYSWNKSTEEATLKNADGDKILLGNEIPVVYFNDSRYVLSQTPFMRNGSLYVPLREVAEMLHAIVSWNDDTNTVAFTTVTKVMVTQENSLADISKDTGISQAKLLARNGMDHKADVQEGKKLSVVIPSVFDNPAKSFTEADLKLLANISQIEAGRNTYEGQLGVANVILNRVQDSRFPSTIHGVIYSGKQFPPAHNGKLDKSTPNASALRAAKDALNGKNNVKNALYFYNPKVTKGPFWSSLETVATIGSHTFAR